MKNLKKKLAAALLCLIANLGFTTAHSQTPQSTSTLQTKPVWELVREITLSPEQKQRFDELRQKLEDARAAVRIAESTTNTPPDALYNARVTATFAQRNLTRAIEQSLTSEQKTELRRLRGEKRAAAEKNAEVGQKSEQSGRALSEEELEATSKKKKPRPTLTDEEYTKLAAELRAQYSRPSSQWPAPEIDDSVKPHFQEIGVLPNVPHPAENPYTDAKAELGKKLFFDPRLSGTGEMSCTSCHEPDLGWADGRTLAFGHSRKELKRNTPSILNAGLIHPLFWDGRSTSLEDQARDVLLNEDEMRNTPEGIRERLAKIPGYTNEFAKVFGSPEPTIQNVAKAIATFERTVTSKRNQFDLFARGESEIITDAAVRGLHIFRTTGRCINCHMGPLFSDNRFHNNGLSNYGRKGQDLGRYDVTKKAENVGEFKTPSLRNVTRTAPYMHHGMFDLETALDMYNAGMPNIKRRPNQANDPLFPTKSPLLKELGLNEHDIADLKAFLETLTDTRSRVRLPELPPDVTKAE